MATEWKADSHHTSTFGSLRSARPGPELPADLLSPDLYELLVWGFTERNTHGQWVLRRDLQAHVDGTAERQRRRDDSYESPLYVGYRCQACWESAVVLVAYGRHICPDNASLLGEFQDLGHP